MCAGASEQAMLTSVERFLQRLLRQRVHQIEVEIIEFGGTQFLDRPLRILRR